MIRTVYEGQGFHSGINIIRKNYFDLPVWHRPIKGLMVAIGDRAFGFMKIIPAENGKKKWGWFHLCRWNRHPWSKIKSGQYTCTRL